MTLASGLWRGLALGAALIAGVPAKAHTFLPEGGFYDRFLEGATVVLDAPVTLLPLLALGVMLSLWDRDGFVRALPLFLAGQAAGIGLAAVAGLWIIPTLIGAGALTAMAGALFDRPPAALALGLSAAVAVTSVGLALEGHGLFELPLPIHLGILFAITLAVALVAGLTRTVLEAVPALWMRIGWRVVSSWIGAVLILYLAFTLAG